MNFADLETTLDPVPLFPVEAADGRKELAELERQAIFRRYAANLAPRVIVFANANAGKRNPMQAKREGIMAGVFDMTCTWDIAASTDPNAPQSVCWIEFKGYDKNGRPGKLSKAQIDWGNAMHERGHKVACFFSGKSAFDWLASLGAPIRGRAQ
jgi:hypothetical protein